MNRLLVSRLFRSPTLRTMVIEVILITCGVLLALGVDQWNTDRVMRNRADEALSNISREMEQNLEILNTIHPQNSAVLEAMDAPEADQPEEDSHLVPGLQILDTAWKTMLSTGVSEHIDYETLFLVSRVYALQEIYKKLGYQLVEQIQSTTTIIAALNPEAELEEMDDDLFRAQIGLLIEAERLLIEVMESAVEKLPSANSGAPDR